MAGHSRRTQKKHPMFDGVQEPLPKRLYLETPEIINAVTEPRPRRQTRVARAPKPLRLTRKNLRLLDKITRVAWLDAAAEPGKPKPPSSSASKTMESDKTKPTANSGFQKQAMANGVLTSQGSKPAHNAQETLERFDKRRSIASPTVPPVPPQDSGSRQRSGRRALNVSPVEGLL